MDTEFKVPSNESKVKFVPRKTKESESVETPAENVAKIIAAALPVDVARSVANAPLKTTTNSPYKEPKWSKRADAAHTYSFEVLKGGQIVENVRDLQSKAFWTIGKLPDNNIVMSHPTISRYHAVLQYRPARQNDDSSDSGNEDEEDASGKPEKPTIEHGWYLYDLASTHGSFVNKFRVPPKTYIRLRVGYMLKFGTSTRRYILQGPNFDEDAESELTITEMKELRRKKLQEFKDKLAAEEKRKEAEGVSWGMADDADEETDLSVNPFATTNNEELFLQDPKKTLRGFFEREGFDLEYKVDEMAAGSYICRIELPITDGFGRNIIAELSHKGKKKECVLQCALEACRILDRHGVLRQANHEPQRKRKTQSSDDDDDEFYDRTTEAEEKRKRKVATEEDVALSYEQLIDEETKIQQTISDVEQKISKYQEQDKLAKQRKDTHDDDLDDFMSHLSNEKTLDKTAIKKLRFELQRLKNDLSKTKKLINIARPLELPPLKLNACAKSPATDAKKKPSLPLFGKKRTFGFGNPMAAAAATAKATTKVAKIDDSSADRNLEEFDDDNEPADGSNSNSTIEPIAVNEETEVPKRSPATDEREIIPVNKKESKKVAQTNVATESSSSKITTDENKSTTTNTPDKFISAPCETNEIVEHAETAISKRKRNRNRNRGDKGRENIDMDEIAEPIESEKYSKWVPPENQSGDGITDLNTKYGY